MPDVIARIVMSARKGVIQDCLIFAKTLLNLEGLGTIVALLFTYIYSAFSASTFIYSVFSSLKDNSL